MLNNLIRVLGIAGSLRRESYNRAALRAATKLTPDGAILEVFELDGIQVFNQDEDHRPPPKVAELKQRIREADAILFVTLEYIRCHDFVAMAHTKGLESPALGAITL